VELKESKALIEAVVENVPLMIFLKESKDLRFVIFNRAGEELLGYDRRDLMGKNNLDLFPPEQAAHFMAKDREVLDGEVGLLDIPEEPILTARKGQRWLHTRKVCLKGPDGVTKFLLGISEDITERKLAEEKIQASLQEKEILLGEVHHRVKNNMQVISGLLDLQARASTNPELIEKLNESRSRIRSMSLIHEKLYGFKDFAKLDLAGYVRTLSQDLLQSYRIDPGKIDLIIQGDDEVYVDINQAIPCGLILNELISNVLKHAFPGDGPGELRIIMAKTIHREIEIIVRDNGLGLPDDVDIHQPRTVGLHLVNGLVKNQLDGQMEVRRGQGTEFRFIFPL
jgi:PAS domain S-box-containing protein